MGHLINTLSGEIVDVRQELQEAHDFLVKCAQAAQTSVSDATSWGIDTKRVSVALNVSQPPLKIGKPEERMGELVNMTATVERLLDALRWFETHNDFKQLTVVKCHPSTSSGENDLVLGTQQGQVSVLCEVSDVASDGDGNGKANKDIASLYTAWEKHTEHARYFLCVSSEFAPVIERKKHLAANRRVALHKTGEKSGTVLIEVSWNASASP